jgi:hypothetical protein
MDIHRLSLLAGAGIATLGALLHVACIAGGPAWFQFFHAPPAIVRSAELGTWLAPVSTTALALAMLLAAALALSLAGVGPRLPLARAAVIAVAALCALRVLAGGLILLRRPDLFTPFERVATSVFLAVAVTYGIGAAMPGRAPTPAAP